MRYELTEYEWAAIKPFLPNKPRGVPRVNDQRHLLGLAVRCAMARPAGEHRTVHDLQQSLRSVAQGWSVGPTHECVDR